MSLEDPHSLVAIDPTTTAPIIAAPIIAALGPLATREDPTANPIRTVGPIRAKATPKTAMVVRIGK
jgi:hypothetical protein